MNKKGAIGTGTLSSILILTFIMIALFAPLVLNTNMKLVDLEEANDEYVKDMNGLERVFSIFAYNVSSEINEVNYEDIDKEYKFKEVSYVDRKESESNAESKNILINNKTDVKIKTFVTSHKDHFPYYDVYVFLNDEVIYRKDGESSSFLEIEIPEDFLYNTETGETNYGMYRVELKNRKNVSHYNVEVEYTKLLERVVSIKGKRLDTQILKIDNSSKKEREVKIEMVKGGA